MPVVAGRRTVLGGLCVTLAGCGFRPLYSPGNRGGSVPVTEAMAAVYVPVFAERPGQLLRQALQQRLEGPGSGVAKRYELTATIAIAADAIGLLRDSSASRVRLIGSAPWVLRALSLERPVLAQGSSRVLDGYNVINQQFFAADISNEVATIRIADALADQITTQIGAYFLREAAAAG